MELAHFTSTEGIQPCSAQRYAIALRYLKTSPLIARVAPASP